MMLSNASFASCLAIMSCCEVCVAAMARPNTPRRLTSPTVSTAIEITTSRSENPLSVVRGAREVPPRLVAGIVVVIVLVIVIGVPIDNLPNHCCRAAIREPGPYRPTE